MRPCDCKCLEIISGYSNVFRPPYTITHPGKTSTIYCISTQYDEVLVLIPLVPNFFADVYRIVKAKEMKRYYFIAPDVSIPFASDYFLSWDYIHRQLGHECKIFSLIPFENYAPEQFKRDNIVLANGTVNFSVPFNMTDDVSVSCTLSTKYVQASNPYACNVEVYDTNNRMLFVGEMNETLAKAILDKKDYFDEVHMPYITGNYGGMTYLQLMQKFPLLYQKIVLNQFASEDEYNYAKKKNLKTGRFYHCSYSKMQ